MFIDIFIYCKFYHINEKYIVNAWNDYRENYYLEPDKKMGFAYLNYLSKAIFNIENYEIYNLETLNNKCKIAIQVHIFYEDLIGEIINALTKLIIFLLNLIYL